MRSIVYWCGHHCFGDAFCLTAAAHLRSLETRQPVYVHFWEPFKYFVNLFENVIWVENPNYFERNLDCGADPDFKYHNGVSRFFRFMTEDGSIRESFNSSCDIKMKMTLAPEEDRKYVSILTHGNVNGVISKDVFSVMLKRAKIFYPNHEFIVVGHYNNNIDLYPDLTDEYNLIDRRTTDRTCIVILQQLKFSSLVLGPHTGIMYPALGLGCRVWCEESKNKEHNFCLDFSNNRPIFY